MKAFGPYWPSRRSTSSGARPAWVSTPRSSATSSPGIANHFLSSSLVAPGAGAIVAIAPPCAIGAVSGATALPASPLPPSIRSGSAAIPRGRRNHLGESTCSGGADPRRANEITWVSLVPASLHSGREGQPSLDADSRVRGDRGRRAERRRRHGVHRDDP